MSKAFFLLALVSMTPAAWSAVPMTPAGNGHLVIPAEINGKGPFAVILDTGADGTGVYQWFADQQKFDAGAMRPIEGMTGTVTMPTYLVDRIGIDGQFIHDVQVDSYPNRKDNEKQAAIIGNDFMDGRLAVFDFPCRRLEILPKPVDLSTILSEGSSVIKGGTVLDGTQLTFPITVGTAHGTAVLDTGARETKLNPEFARAAGINTASDAFHHGETIYGANAKALKTRYGPLGTVRFAGISLPDANAQVADLPVLSSFGLHGPAMIFGLDFLRGIRLVYDHEAKEFWFDHSACSAPALPAPVP